MDIKAVNNSKDKHNQVQAKQPEKGVSGGKTSLKKEGINEVSDRITLSSTGLDRNSVENAAEQVKNLILADNRTAILSMKRRSRQRKHPFAINIFCNLHGNYYHAGSFFRVFTLYDA